MKLAGKMAIIAGGLVVTGGLIVGISAGIAFNKYQKGELGHINKESVEMVFKADATDIEKVDIALISEDFEIKPVNGNEITIEYSDYEENPIYEAKAENNKLTFKRDTSITKIDGIEDIIVELLGDNDNNQKPILISLPRTLVAEYNIASVSGSFKGESLNAKKLNIASTSGNISLDQGSASEDINIVSVSGDINLSNIESKEDIAFSTTSGNHKLSNISCAQNIELNSISGEITANSLSCRNIEVNTTSGSLNFTETSIEKKFEGNSTSGSFNVSLIGDEDDFSIELSTISGFKNLHNKDTDAPKSIEISTISGDIEIGMVH